MELKTEPFIYSDIERQSFFSSFEMESVKRIPKLIRKETRIDADDMNEIVSTMILGPTRPFFRFMRLFGVSTLLQKKHRCCSKLLKVYSFLVFVLAVFAFVDGIFQLKNATSIFSVGTFTNIAIVNFYFFVLISLFWGHYVEKHLEHFIRLFRRIERRGEVHDCAPMLRRKSYIWIAIASFQCMVCGTVGVLQQLGIFYTPRGMLVPGHPVLSCIIAVTMLVLFNGGICSVLFLQILLVNGASAALTIFLEYLESITTLDLDTVKFLRKEFQNVTEIMKHVDKLWTYYYFVFQFSVICMLCLCLFGAIYSKETDFRLLTGYWVINISLGFIATFVGPIKANEKYDSARDLFLKKETELDKMDSILIPDLPTRLSYNHHCRMLLDQMKNPSGYITSGYVFVLSRGSFVTIVSAIVTYFVLIVQFQMDSGPGLETLAMNSTTMMP